MYRWRPRYQNIPLQILNPITIHLLHARKHLPLPQPPMHVRDADQCVRARDRYARVVLEHSQDVVDRELEHAVVEGVPGEVVDAEFLEVEEDGGEAEGGAEAEGFEHAGGVGEGFGGAVGVADGQVLVLEEGFVGDAEALEEHDEGAVEVVSGDLLVER